MVLFENIVRIQDEQLKRFIRCWFDYKADISAAGKIAKEEKAYAEDVDCSWSYDRGWYARVESYVLGIPFVSLKGYEDWFEVLP